MGYKKLAKGVSEEQIRRKLENIMPKQRHQKKQFQANTQSIFVGSHQYPKVNMGTLSPSNISNPQLLDNPKEWYKRKYNISKIAQLRTTLINSKKRTDAKNVQDKKDQQEIAISKKPVNIEIKLDKKPRNQAQGGRIKPISATADLEQLKLGENPSVNKKIEKHWYDTDAKTETSIKELTQKGIDKYKIQKAMTAGVLGKEREQKVVPTRWSITATDSIISRQKREKIKNYQEINQIEYYQNQYLGNKFHIFLLPGKWEYELIELKKPGSTFNQTTSSFVVQNYENSNGRKEYAEETAGAYYAARLTTLKHLENRKRQAKAIIVREVNPEYWAPLGVWIIRETVRNSYKEKHKQEDSEIESIKDVKKKLSQELTVNYPKVKQNSRMLSQRQKSIENYF